jgi:hypothetical protein
MLLLIKRMTRVLRVKINISELASCLTGNIVLLIFKLLQVIDRVW